KEIEEIQAKEKKEVEFDEKGFFVIYLDEGEIVAEHYENVNKGGKLEVETGSIDLIIRGESAKKICDTIIRKDLISRLDHMAYISRELQKAEIALKNNLDFEQSEKLKL
ncbi:MAG: DUF4346 domain-containing protein, partial [Thermoplasmatota archaeon]